MKLSDKCLSPPKSSQSALLPDRLRQFPISPGDHLKTALRKQAHADGAPCLRWQPARAAAMKAQRPSPRGESRGGWPPHSTNGGFGTSWPGGQHGVNRCGREAHLDDKSSTAHAACRARATVPSETRNVPL